MPKKVLEIMEDTKYNQYLTTKRLSHITGKTFLECYTILGPYYDFYNKCGYLPSQDATLLNNDIKFFENRDDVFFDTDINLELQLDEVSIWDSTKDKFIDVTVKINGYYIGVFYLGKLFNVIKLPKNKIMSVTIDKALDCYIVVASELRCCMSKDNAQQIQNYFERYNKNVEIYLAKEYKRISQICDNLESKLGNVVFNFLDYTDSNMLLNHDYVIALQKEYGYIQYNEIEYFNERTITDYFPLPRRFSQQINDFSDILAKDYNLKTEDKKYCAWELIQRAAIKYFSEIWNEKYELYLDNKLKECASTKADGTLDKYIEDVLICNEISINDEALAYFTYFALDKKYILNCIFFPKCFEAIQSAFKAIGQNLRKKTFENNIRKGKRPDRIRYTLDDVDMMTGLEFENFICTLFTKMGYITELTKQTGDQGIDVIASKNSNRIGIQAKCYSNTVGNSAIQEVTAGKKFYNCDKVIVVTNNYFTSSAEQLAQANEVILWDRNMLKEKIKENF